MEGYGISPKTQWHGAGMVLFQLGLLRNLPAHPVGGGTLMWSTHLRFPVEEVWLNKLMEVEGETINGHPWLGERMLVVAARLLKLANIPAKLASAAIFFKNEKMLMR